MKVEKGTVKPIPMVSTTTDEQVAVLEAAGLTGVCTDEHLTVLKAFGDTTPYLKDDNFNFELSELLPQEVAMAIKAVVHKALKSQLRYTLPDLTFDNNGLSEHTVNIVVSPFLSQGELQLLILFSKTERKPGKGTKVMSGNLKKLSMEFLGSLEQELAEAKSNLEACNELINSSNENIQSFNEELQSANEEMHSANEELQSVNEELQTINREQQQTNAELTESNDDLNNYFRSNTNGQLFVDHNLLLKRYSPGAVKHINLRKSDIGRPLADITTNIKLETLVVDIRQVMKDGQTISREAETADGKIYQVMTMPYLRKSTGDTDGAIVSFFEITELKKLLAALDISNKSLLDSVAEIELSREKLGVSLEKEKNLNALKSRFVSMASHEFKTPLTAIQLSASLIGRVATEFTHPVLAKFAETIKNAVKNLTSILDNFLSLELLETGNVNPVLSAIDIVKFGEEITEDMQSLAKGEQRVVYRHVGIGHKVMLNPSLLKNSIINLISNAIKYSGSDSLIEFTTRTTKSYLTIVVKDNGIGIPDEDQAHMFQAFFRATNTDNIAGTGLGLNIVGHYAELMHGKIKFESKVGVGTTFTLEFPIKPIKKRGSK